MATDTDVRHGHACFGGNTINLYANVVTYLSLRDLFLDGCEIYYCPINIMLSNLKHRDTLYPLIFVRSMKQCNTVISNV
jgi:hypothetical protein